MLAYDIETLRGPDEVEGGWNNPEGMGFGTAVLYDWHTDLYEFYGPDQKNALIERMTGFLVASFNGIKFDNAVLLGNDYLDRHTQKWCDYDLLLEVVRCKFKDQLNKPVDTVADAEALVGAENIHDGSIGLDGLARGTLGLGKTGHGSKSPAMIQAGEWAKVFAYNLQDVRLLRKLVDYRTKYGRLIDRDGNVIFLKPITGEQNE